MSQLYWCYPGDQPGGPFDIGICRAETPQQACELFGERFPSPCVHVLTSPLLVGACEALAVGSCSNALVTRLPSAYDEFRTGYRNGVDIQAMTTRGFDVS